MRSSELRLSQFRSAARGAPYLRRIVVRPPAEREAELRAFELERLDGSWRGAALYGQPRRPVQELTLPQTVPVAIALGPRARPHAAAIAGALDRRRLARVGIAPSEALPGLPAPRLRGNDRPSRSLVLVADGADQFQVALAAALEARFDEQRWSVDVQRLEGSALARALASGRWDLRIVQAPPALPGSRNAIASLLVALGDAGGASAVIEGRTTPADAASGVGAIVLGARRSALHTVATLQGAGFDPLGRLRFERLHVRATEDEGGSE